MSGKPLQPTGTTDATGKTAATPQPVNLPQFAAQVEQNVRPVVSEAQRVAAQTSVSGRRAVSRGTIFMIFYLWLLSGVLLLSWIARHTEFFPGDISITAQLQKRHNPWLRRFFYAISEIGL